MASVVPPGNRVGKTISAPLNKPVNESSPCRPPTMNCRISTPFARSPKRPGPPTTLQCRGEIAERRLTVLDTACIRGDIRRWHRLDQPPADIGRSRSLSHAALESVARYEGAVQICVERHGR